jgi:hypothetical protein
MASDSDLTGDELWQRQLDLKKQEIEAAKKVAEDEAKAHVAAAERQLRQQTDQIKASFKQSAKRTSETRGQGYEFQFVVMARVFDDAKASPLVKEIVDAVTAAKYGCDLLPSLAIVGTPGTQVPEVGLNGGGLVCHTRYVGLLPAAVPSYGERGKVNWLLVKWGW